MDFKKSFCWCPNLSNGNSRSRNRYGFSGVSISFCTSGYLRVTGGYICRRPEGPSTLGGSGGMLPRKILRFQTLADAFSCIFRSFFVALLFHFFAPKSTNLNKFEENYVTIKQSQSTISIEVLLFNTFTTVSLKWSKFNVVLAQGNP